MRVEGDTSPDLTESTEVRNYARLVDAMVDQVLAGRAAHGHPEGW